MANIGMSVSKNKSVYLTILVATIAGLALLLATYVAGHQMDLNTALSKKIRIVSLTCAKDNDSHNYNHVELRLRLNNKRITPKTIVWRNSMGSRQKASIWHINETLDIDDEMEIELKDIEIQSGINNQLLGYHVIKSSSLHECPRPITLTGEGAKYSLEWYPVE